MSTSPQLAGALRASVNRSTGYTPNKLMLGRETNQPADLMFGKTDEPQYTGTEEYIIGLEKSLKSAHEIARNTLKTSQAKMKKDYDLRVFERQYAAGDLVYVLDTAQVKGKSKNLSSPWKGPGMLIDKITPFVYKVKLQRVFNTNHDRLKLCKDRNIPAWLQTCHEQFTQGKDVLTPRVKSKAKEYCVCRGLETGETTVQCDQCKEWFHLTCEGLSVEEVDVIDIYACPNCKLINRPLSVPDRGGEQNVQ
ncbi:Hypothetical predicted protein [Mytilus galloprovincialis]|uniref:Zinc finger PHD-type domain-containing protein n=1 Tax=Mytilus galloprovincialis TaxID=29158 RepID=A0A8B6ETQ2_MYTGA|nr:Hypothetical predicted protein [Mytilus galloprovincialis]